MKKEDIKRYFEKIAELNKELNEDDKKEYIGMLLKECEKMQEISQGIMALLALLLWTPFIIFTVLVIIQEIRNWLEARN